MSKTSFTSSLSNLVLHFALLALFFVSNSPLCASGEKVFLSKQLHSSFIPGLDGIQQEHMQFGNGDLESLSEPFVAQETILGEEADIVESEIYCFSKESLKKVVRNMTTEEKQNLLELPLPDITRSRSQRQVSNKTLARMALLLDHSDGAERNYTIWLFNWFLSRFSASDDRWPAEWKEKLRSFQERVSVNVQPFDNYNLKVCATNSIAIAITSGSLLHHVVFGPEFDQLTPISAGLLSAFGVPQMGYSVTKSELANKNYYAYYSRVTPSVQKLARAMAQLVARLGWQRMAFLSDNGKDGNAALPVFLDQCNEEGITVKYSRLLDLPDVDHFLPLLQSIKDSNVKIVAPLFLDEGEIISLLVAAEKLEMIGNGFIWIFPESVIRRLLQNTNSTLAEKLDFWLDGSLGLGPIRGIGSMYDNLFAPDFIAAMRDKGNRFFDETDISVNVTYMHDAVLAVAFALGSLIENNIPFSANATLVQTIRSQSFYGITGPVKLDSAGERLNFVYQITNYQKGSGIVEVGYLDVANTSATLVLNETVVWRGGVTTRPSDRTPPTTKYISEGLVIGLFTVASFLICVVVAIAIITTKEKDLIIIQHSGYLFLLNILIGTLLMISSIYVMGVDSRFASLETIDRLCMLQVWMVGIGYVLIFGSLFSKSLRILLLTHYAKLSTAQHLDYKIMGIVFVVLLGEIIILIVWNARDPLEALSKLSSSELEVSFFCESDNKGYPLSWISFNALFMIGGIALAFLTRNIENRFNESKLIAFSIYNVFLIAAVVTPISFLIDDNPNVTFAIKSLGVIGISMIPTGMLFGNILYIIFLGKLPSNSNENGSSNRLFIFGFCLLMVIILK